MSRQIKIYSCLQNQLFSSLVLKELKYMILEGIFTAYLVREQNLKHQLILKPSFCT